MDKTVTVSLNGHAGQFRLEGDAYDELSRYLDRAAARLPADSDRAEVLGDLERSVGDKLVAKLAATPGSEDRIVTAAEIEAILEEIGGFEGDDEQGTDLGVLRRLRRLRRIRAGQQLAGVCTGLAEYAEIKVSAVRTVFLFATVLTAGGFALVYAVLAFLLPVRAARPSYDR